MKKSFKKGDIGSYIQDYSDYTINLKKITGEEFKNYIEESFPNLIAKLEKTNGWGNTPYNYVPVVYKNDEIYLYNKLFICIKEATKNENGLIIGIHDFSNYIIELKY